MAASPFPSDIFHELVTLVVILDPLATVPVFLAVTAGLPAARARRVAFYAVGVSFGILAGAAATGQILLEALGVPMASFQLAGSVILFLLGLKMVNGELMKEIASFPADASPLERAVYPLATPIVAGAGAVLTVVMLTDNATRSVAEQIRTVGLVAIALGINLLCFLIGSSLFRFLGRTGIEAMTRIFGLVLAAVAVHGIVTALRASFWP
jgi:multiple antibiotic resistance protein